MRPLFSVPVRLCAGLACTLAIASAAVPLHAAVDSPVAPSVMASPAASFSVAPPANYVFLQPEAQLAESATAASSSSDEALPEAPQPVNAAPAAAAAGEGLFADSTTGGMAPKYAITIASGETAQRISAGDKVVIGLRQLYSPVQFAGIIISAGYSHLVDGQPNYGVDRTAFAQRFGAGVARSASQQIFTTSVLAPIFHQDPRYYVLGSNAGFFHRVIYAATRPIITKTDGGRSTINASLLIGYAGAAALTPTYYPPINRNFHDVASTYGASLGGAAIGFAFSEFSDQLLKAVHMKH